LGKTTSNGLTHKSVGRAREHTRSRLMTMAKASNGGALVPSIRLIQFTTSIGAPLTGQMMRMALVVVVTALIRFGFEPKGEPLVAKSIHPGLQLCGYSSSCWRWRGRPGRGASMPIGIEGEKLLAWRTIF
jgi:hypothetical protein